MSCKIKAYRKCLLAIPLAVLFHLDCFQKTEPDLIGTLNDFLIRSFFDQRTYSTAGRHALLLAFESMAIFLFFLSSGVRIFTGKCIRGGSTW